jgi:hypothetical protein
MPAVTGAPLTPIHDAFLKACDNQRRKLQAGNLTDVSVFKLFVFDHLDRDRAPDSKGIGYWVRTRVMHGLLKQLGWTAKTVQNHLYHLCETISPARDLAPRRFACLVEAEAQDHEFRKLAELLKELGTKWEKRVWPCLGAEPFQGKSALDLGAREFARKFLNAYYATPTAFEEKLNEVLKARLRQRADVVVDTGDLEGVPVFAAKHVEEQKKVVESLIAFIRKSDGPHTCAIAGEAATGKSGIFQEVIRRLYTDGELGGDRHVVCLNVSQLRSFDIILSRLNSFSRRSMACEAHGAPTQLSHESYEQPLEMNIGGFTDNMRQLRNGVLFFFSDVEASVAGTIDGAPYMLQDERLNWLTRIITASGPNHKIIMGLLPAGEFTPTNRNSRVLAYIEPPGVNALSAFTDSFPGASGLRAKMDLAFADVRRSETLKSTVIIAAMNLHKIAAGRQDISEDEVNRVIASNKSTPDDILGTILHLIEPDKRALVTIALLSLSPEGIRRNTLVKFLRYHREYNPLLRDLPPDCRRLTRNELAEEDAAFLAQFEEQHSILVSRYNSPPRFRDNEGLSNDSSETLYITTGLRPSLERVIERTYPELAELVHRLLAKGKRRVSMRARLANTKPHGKTLEEVQSDFDAAVHLLASIQMPKTTHSLHRQLRAVDGKELERRVFTRPRGRAVEIVNFVLSELIKKDLQLGQPERMSNAWVTDEVILKLLLRLFHLGPSEPDMTADLPSRIPESLVACLCPNDIAWLVTAVARTAWRLQDFQLLKQAIALEPSMVALGADPEELRPLHLLKLDCLVGTAALREAEKYALGLLKNHGGIHRVPTGTAGEVLCDLHSKARRAARSVVRESGTDERRLTFRIRVLARLGEIYELTGRDGSALRAFFEGEEIGRRMPGRQHPVLSGDVGRKFLKVLVRLAATNYCDRPNVFAWAKAKAEDVHRRNIERISGFPAERTDILIDEALLERHLRGDAGKGDLQLSQNVLAGDRAEMAALAAPRVDRLEYLLERAKGAMLLSRSKNDQQAENGIRDLNLIEDLLLSSGAHPPFIEREADRTRARLEHVEDRTREDRSMGQAGFRTDQLVDCIRVNDTDREISWFGGPILI